LIIVSKSSLFACSRERKKDVLGIVIHACNISTWKAAARGLHVQSLPELNSETLSQKKKAKKKNEEEEHVF
jgi:hypothetical protein